MMTSRGYDYTLEDLQWVPKFMNEVKEYFYVREEDNLLILRPNKVMNLNDTGVKMLKMLLQGKEPQFVIEFFINHADAERQQVLNDLADFVTDLREMVSGNQNIYTYSTAKIVPFGHGKTKYPVLSEIAVTYRCNNKCKFCYAYSPYRKSGEMTTEEIRRVID
ncbi:MAG: PqqD family peptide modification chaperone, partial [Promethearchaeati archaeon]